MSKIAIFGTAFVDCKGYVTTDYGKDCRNAGNILFVHGGVGRNVAENVSCLGEKTVFVSSVDGSGLGKEIIERLSDEGVDTSHIITSDNGMGMWMVIIDRFGEQQGSVSRRPDFALLGKYISENAEGIIADCDAVMLEIDLNREIFVNLIDICEKLGKPIYGITGNMSVVLPMKHKLCKLACYICNETEAGQLFGSDFSSVTPDKALEAMICGADKLGLKSCVVTLGEAGCVYYNSITGEKGKCDAIPTDVIDTVGAGDAFFSGAVTSLIHGKTFKDAVYDGSKIASAVIASNENTLYGTKLPATI